jgi:aminopeptidase
VAFDNERFAALICDWCLEVAPGQRILASTSTLAAPVISALHAALLEREAWLFGMLVPAEWANQILEHGRDIHLDGADPFQRVLLTTADAIVRIEAPTNTRALSGADPERMGRLARGAAELAGVRADKRWAVSIWPTEALAQEAGMSFATYERFVSAAMFLDRPDPLAAWRALRETQQALVARLTGTRRVRILAERTDVTLDVSDRTWINSDGKRNMPSGEVFTSPHEASASGRIFFDIPSNHGGTHVSGVALTLVDGVVREAHAEQGDEQLQAKLSTDAGARRIGEIGIGTNWGIERATGSTLLDEKIGGTVHLALGRSYSECGGLNQSAIHWDLVCDLRMGGEISVDGELISRDGQFV